MIRQIKFSSTNEQEDVYKNCKFRDPLAKVLVIGHGHFSHIAKILSFSFKKSSALLLS